MKYLYSIFGLIVMHVAVTQTIQEHRFSYDPSGQSLPTLILQAETNFPVSIFYKKQWIDTVNAVSVPGNNLLDILSKSLEKSGFTTSTKDDYFIFIFPDTDRIPELNANPNVEIKARIDFIELGSKNKMVPNELTKVSGYVSDATGESIPGATILIDGGATGSTTNPLGYYEVYILPGEHDFIYSYLGYEAEAKKVKVFSAGQLNINLFESTSILEEVTIADESAQEKLKSTSMGKSDLSIYAINKMPAFLGESDVIKSISILPGVSVTGESSSYISVRGGNYDQNLILMNNIPIYNPSHLLGFFSVFNPDMVSKVSLYKGSIPARYDSRASSVLDVKLSPKASKPMMGYGGIGILTSSLGVKGQVLQDKLSYTIGARATYSDWILNAVPDKDAKTSSASFWDFNSILHYQLNSKNNFEGTFYRANDQFKFSQDTTYSYEQMGFNTSWNHLFSNDLLYNFNVSYSNYQYDTEGEAINEQFLLKNGIRQSSIQNNLTLSIGTHTFEGGLQINQITSLPGSLKPNKDGSLVDAQSIAEEKAWTFAGYLEDEFKISENLRVKAGLRYTSYHLQGPINAYTYEENAPHNETTIAGEESYDGKSYDGLEPRISASYVLPWGSVKLGYNRLFQYQHLISNAVSITPLDQWKLSDQFIKPVISDQIALGIFRNFMDNALEVSLETYVKRYQNLIEYKNGAQIVMNDNLEQEIITGNGKAWGVEFMLSKTKGATQGWVSYAYARTFIQTNGKFEEETINDGNWYPYYSDRPHNINLTIDQKLSNRWSMGVNFKYASGRPISAPTAKFVVDNVTVAYFEERNNARIPDYHRMDISFTHENKVKKNQRFRSRWIFSIYNLYFHKNAYSVYFKDSNGVPAQPYKLTIAGSMIPSLTYKFEFD